MLTSTTEGVNVTSGTGILRLRKPRGEPMEIVVAALVNSKSTKDRAALSDPSTGSNSNVRVPDRKSLFVEWEVFQRATPYDLGTSGHQFRAHLERWRDNGRRQLLNQLADGGIVQGL